MENDNLLHFRLRSVRRRKRAIRKDVEKQIRKKYKRSRKLWKIRRNLPLIPLDKPYQKGFVRFFVVREDVKQSKDGDFFEGILKKINTYMYSDNRKFLKKKRKFGRKIYVEREQKLRYITSYSWNYPKWELTDRERQYFEKKEDYCPVRKIFGTYYKFTEPWRFTLRVTPNMITHYKPLDLELEKEYAALDSYLGEYKVIGIMNKTILCKSNPWKETYQRKLIKSRKYATCTMSATEIAESLLDI
ncbi:hypothetical protein J2786_004182 [Chryseobacterium vietnamense]|uniref:Uncharacterized protein n=1 Tax=Chryseobacterium vietnamense TaxID=866785 RepID=A0ACC6JD69_9FLAO|nr:hypothetical protein [Chryseobacterium vietnamense]MDR6461031.1 hypothetical protein [Chryseobacterium vietnamense]